jgi:hypothetical protein
VDTTKKTVVVHDGATAGGQALAKESSLTGVVRFDQAQSLTVGEKANVMGAIGAMTAPTGQGLVVKTASGAVSRTLTAGTGISVTNGDGQSGAPTVANTGVLTVNGQAGNVSVGGFSMTDVLAADGAGSGLDADLLDGFHASTFETVTGGAGKYVKKDHGHNAVGSFCFARHGSTSVGPVAGTTYAGSALNASAIADGGVLVTGAVLTGTWRALGTGMNYSGMNYSGTGNVTLFQRIS